MLLRLCALAVAAAFAHSVPAQEANDRPAAAMVLGVQTHFAQGWPADRADLARASGAALLRDSLPWASVETRAGRYAFDGPAAAALEGWCRSGGTLLLTAVPLNPLYDSGQALRSAGGKAAFAAYLVAVQAHLGRCLAAVEIGNEINSANSGQIHRRGEAGVDPLAEYVDLVRTARDALRRQSAGTKVLGGSSNMIATGFLDALFARGLLDAADGIAVHPYRSQAENIDVELAHLHDVMRRHGKPLPVWASEFSDNYPQAPWAAPQLVKAATLLAASGVEAASWYALVDQKWFVNMGLYTAAEAQKPAARAYRLMQRILPAAGTRPQRIDVNDPAVRLYRLPADAWIVWGASGTIRFDASARLLDAQGNPLPSGQLSLSDDPVIALGSSGYRFTAGPVLADSLLDYGGARWRYFARHANGSERALGWLDGQWSSLRGDRNERPLWISDVAGTPIGAGPNAVEAVIRYTAPAARSVAIAVCVDKKAGGDGIDVSLRHGGSTLASGVVTRSRGFVLRNVRMAAGDDLDLAIGPRELAGSDGFRYRMRIYAEPAAPAAECPARPARV